MDTLRQTKRHSRFRKNPSSTIARTLRDRIISGQYQVGSLLPSERALERDLNIDRRTVRAAIEELKTEGLLDQRPNCRPLITSNSIHEDDGHYSDSGVPMLSSTRIIALVMWHGGVSGRAGTAQQRIFWGMIEALSAARYHAIFLDVGPDSRSDAPDFEREASSLSYALSCGFGGIVFFPQAYDQNRELMHEVTRQMPLVLLDRIVPGVQADVVGLENRQSTFDATWHLIEQGHKRIAFVAAGEYTNTVEDRIRGYLQAIHKAFPLTAYEMVLTPPFTDSDSWREFDAIIRLPGDERPTAFVCTNNDEAVRVSRHLAEHGLSVPEDVSLVGFSHGGQTLPNGVALTCIDMPFEEIGREAAKLLLRRMENPSAKFVHVEVPTALIEHESVRSRTPACFGTNGTAHGV